MVGNDIHEINVRAATGLYQKLDSGEGQRRVGLIRQGVVHHTYNLKSTLAMRMTASWLARVMSGSLLMTFFTRVRGS